MSIRLKPALKGSAEAALSVTHHPCSYSRLMGLSGMAFRMRWYVGRDGKGSCPSSPVGEFAEETAAMERATGERFVRFDAAGLRHNGIVAPLVLDGPMDGLTFRAYVEQALAPALAPGDVLVLDNLSKGSSPLYDPRRGVEASIEALARRIYRADKVEYAPKALKDLAVLRENGWDELPVCISKTQYSFSDEPTALGAPTGHTLHVRELIPRTGAGFIVVLTGAVMTMPGLPARPAAEGIDIGADGKISGLF